MAFLVARYRVRLSVLLLGVLAACQSKTDSGTTTATAPVQQPAAAGPQDSPGTWYRIYRGTLGTDSITLHLQTWPAGFESRRNASFVGSYSGADGQPYELGTDYNTEAKPDSIVLRDRDLTFADDNGSGPVWRLRLVGKELMGTRGSQRVQLREATLPGSITFASRYFTDSVAAYPGKPASPHGRTSLHVLLPTSGPETIRRTLTDGILRNLRGDSLATKAVPASVQQYWQQRFSAFQKDYRASVADLAPNLPTNPDTSSTAPSYDYVLRFEDQAATHVLWNQDNLLSLGFFSYSYSGGAHGNYGTSAATFNARTGQELRFKDILRSDAQAQLSALLEQAVRRTLKQPANVPLDQFLFVKKMPVTYNVYLTSGGAVFIYTPYEIASYAQGEIRLFVPREQLRPLLKSGLPWGGGEVSRR
ncbi:DUF3298 and DUF4163 domain-containing protein [Hymenobacter sp. BT186]|uniref:DUF3298 and DUF4163 domain-containing protein n=1 Tax=Hymenobacter telluris TaxID=2816474 RepID=A0A939EWH9_9BACT|nr:DUF3298 and DUF4163 domain-containing protein [Hymenobacter telluris]MBO0358800.1 DUF3298 and DUF4163 domain-containing protein [Hymenobacter telluris]MBW3374826.1 DUF3298 and DUF4163 domain-containing protein [Hymenobacter norwichensis]